MNTVQRALLLCVHICALPLAAAPILVTANTVNDPAPRTLNTSGTYRIADSATLTFRNSLGATGTDGGVFAYNGSATYTLLFTATGATDPATGFPAGTGAVVFENNHADKHGGAISIADTRVTLTLANATFAFNNTGSGNGGALVTNGTSRIHNTLFTSNTAGASGGAFQNTGNAVLSDMRFEGNVAATTGGAIYNSTNSLTLTGGAFVHNSARGNGGALYNTGANSSVTLADAIFTRNESAANSGGGGALYINSGTVSVTRGIFDANKTTGTSSSHGGAIYNNGATLTLTDAVFTNNSANAYGGALYMNRGTVDFNITTTATSSGNKAGTSGTATAANGNFLYVTGTDAVVNFNISGAATRYVIGDANATDRNLDNIASGGSGAAATAPALNKNGDGTLILNADNSAYRGRINVNSGALLLGNSAARLNAAALTANGGALGGLGTISGAVEFLATSTLFVDGGLLAFATTATTGVTLRDGASIGGSGTLALTGANNTLFLDSGTIAAAVSSGKMLTLAAAFAGPGALEKRDAGLLVLAATTDTFARDLVLSGGTLAFSGTNDIALANTLSVSDATHTTLDAHTRTLTLAGALSGSGTLTKTGQGTLTFLGANASAFAGTLRIAEGGASLSGAYFGGSVRIEPNTRLDASGFIAGDLAIGTASALRISTNSAAAMLVVGGTFFADNATLAFALYDGVTPDGFLNSDRILAADVVATGVNTIDIASFAQTGTYNLGNIAALAMSRVTVGGAEQLPDFRRKASLATSGSQLLLIAQIDMSRTLTWTGGGGASVNIWSPALAGQWTDSDTVNRFADGDRVIFQIAAPAIIEIPGDVTASDMLVNNHGTLTFRGAQITADPVSVITGTLDGATGRLVKTGIGTLAFENGANTFRGGIVLEDGALAFTRAAQLGDGGRGILITGNGMLKFAAPAENTETLANAIALPPGATATIETAGNTLVLAGAITGSGALTKTGAGTLVVAAPAAHKGTTAIAAGTLRAGAPNVLSRDSHIALAAGATLDLAGHSQTIRSLANRGALALGTGAPRLDIAGDYAAAPGSEIRLSLALSDTAAPQAGSLAIGGAATGQTAVSIQILDTRETTRNLALPDGSLAPLITTAVASSGSAFALAGGSDRIVIGAYDYVLEPDNRDAARAWSLALDTLSPEIPAVAGTDVLALQSNRSAMDTLAARLAEHHFDKNNFIIWTDALLRRDTVNKTIHTGASVSISGLQAGADFSRHADGSDFGFGIFADFSDAELQLASRMRSEARANGTGVYARFCTRSWQFHLIARGAKIKYGIAPPAAPRFDTRGDSYGAALEAARAFRTKSGWHIALAAEASWMTHSIENAADSFGRIYRTEDFSSMTARLTAAFERVFVLKNNNSLIPRVRLGAANEFDARTRMTVAGTPVESTLDGLAAELDAALIWRIATRWSLSARAAARAGGNFDGYGISLGASRAW